MKKLLIVIFVFLVAFANSQDPNKSISKVKLTQSKYFKKEDLGLFAGNDATNIYYCKIKKQELVLRVFSKDLELITSKKANLPDRYKTLKINDIVRKDDELIIASTFHNKKIGKTIRFRESFDFNTLTSKDNFKKTQLFKYLPGQFNSDVWFHSINYIKGYSIGLIGKDNIGEWSVEINRFNEDVTENDKVTLFFAKSFGKLHKFESMRLFNNGNNLAVISRYYNSIHDYKEHDKIRYKAYEVVEKKVDKPNYHYLITILDLNANTAKTMISKQVRVNTNENDFIKYLNVSDIGHDSLLISGAYSSANIINAKGLYSFIINVEKMGDYIIIKDKYEFTDEFILKYMTDDEIVEMNLHKSKGVPYDFFDYKILSLSKVKDGYIAAIEKSDKFLTIKRERTGNVYTVTTVYNMFYSDLFMTSISEDGHIKDVIKIPKRQVVANEFNIFGKSSLMRIIDDKTLFIIPDILKKYIGNSRRLISYVVDNNTGVINSDMLITYENLQKANLTLSDIWLDKYRMLAKVKNNIGTKEKLVIVDFREFVSGQ